MSKCAMTPQGRAAYETLSVLEHRGVFILHTGE